MHTIPQRQAIEEEGTALAYSGVMPIAQQIPPAASADSDPSPATDAFRRELTAVEAKREADARIAEAIDTDNLYDNVACTD